MQQVYSAIHSDLRQILLTVPGIPATIHYMGKPFSRVIGVPYVQEALAPVSSVVETLGTSGETSETWLYNLDLFWPQNSGLFDAYDLADAIRETYSVGRTVGSTEVFGRITSASRYAVLVGTDWLQLPVSIGGFVRRQTVVV